MTNLERILIWMIIQAAYDRGYVPLRLTYIPWQSFVDARWALRCDFYAYELTH